MIRSNIQKYSLVFLSAIFSMSVFFVFANLWYTDGFKENTNNQMQSLMIIAATITILFSVFIISYVHWYLIRERAKSFAVLLSYGMLQKDLRKLIIGETLIIYVISLGSAFITGSIFSKLFFMISTKLLSIENENLEYQLTFECFIITAVVFAVIFSFVLLTALVRISHKDLIELGKSKRDVELNNKGNIFIGCLGLLLVIGSIATLYLHNRQSTEHMSKWILGTGLVCLIGTYLLISHFSRLIYGRLKKDSKRYYNNILEASEFAMGYRQNRKTMFILTLLTFGIILFTSVTYTLYKESYRIVEIENPHDLYYQEIEALNILDEAEVGDILAGSDTAIVENKELSFLYMEAPDLMLNNWRNFTWIPVASESAYNICFDSEYKVKTGEAIQIIFESDIDRDFHFFKDEILLKNGTAKYTLKSVAPIYDKILNRYIFTQPIILIVNDTDFLRFTKEASAIEKGMLHLYQFEDWKKSKEICDAFTTKFYDKYDEVVSKNDSINNELIKRYGYAHLQVRSKINYLEIQKMQGSFSLFIMGFVSILFICCILITYFFKVFMGASEDIERFKKLDGIGLMQKEKEKLIKIRIQLLMFVPAVLGIIIEMGWCLAINFKKILEIDLTNTILLRNALCTGAIFFAMVYIYYRILKSTYFKRLKL